MHRDHHWRFQRLQHLDHAIEIQNAGEFGLTGGIHSLDQHEIAHWLERVEVGNVYINRHITGAIVRRQPFGGWKRSSVGCGPKAGGPFYVEAFGTWSSPAAAAVEELELATGPSQNPTYGSGKPQLRPQPSASELQAEFQRVWDEFFAVEHDPSGLACERNILRFRPLPSVGLYIAPDADPSAVQSAQIAQRVMGLPPTLVVSPMTGSVERVRVIGSLTTAQLAECHAAGVEVDLTQPVADPMVELRRWVREQSISWTRHRHGRLLD